MDLSRTPIIRAYGEEKSMAKQKPRYVYRSAVTGRYVKASYAKRYPDRTVRERVR